MTAARKLNQHSATCSLTVYGPDTCDSRLAALYDAWHDRTGEPTVAAVLTLAQTLATIPSTAEPQSTAGYLTIKQAADKYNLGTRTIYRMVEQGLPVVRAGKAIRIKPRDLERRLADSETILR